MTFPQLWNWYTRIMPDTQRLTYPAFIRAVKALGGPDNCTDHIRILEAHHKYLEAHPHP